MSIPFTYIITHVPSGMKYYGVRFAKNCSPSDIGVTYFSSSGVVKKMILDEGVENFSFEVRKIFSTKEDALKWENKFLTRINAVDNDKWLNMSNGHARFYVAKHSEETKKKMRKPKSDEHRAKLKKHLDEKRVIPKWTDEMKKKLSLRISGEGNHNFGRSDHIGALKLVEIAKSRRGKTWEELYGKEKADEMRSRCGNRKVTHEPCPHCGYSNKPSYMKKWHFEKCKHRKS